MLDFGCGVVVGVLAAVVVLGLGYLLGGWVEEEEVRSRE